MEKGERDGITPTARPKELGDRQVQDHDSWWGVFCIRRRVVMNKVDIELVVEVDNDNLNELKLDDIKKLEVFVKKSEENMNMD